MKKMMGALIALALAGSIPAWGDGLTFAGAVTVTGNGFGAAPRALTIQSHGPSSTSESGCIAPGGGGLIAGGSACAPGGFNVGGDEKNPIGFPKQSAPSLSSLGITNGNQVGILFDGVQPQSSKNSAVSISNLTLKLYDGTSLVYTASGSWSNLATNPGNGTSDYLFVLDPSGVLAFNTAFAGNTSDVLALDSTITFARQSAGPDSYSFVKVSGGIPTAPTPEPSSLLLVATGLLGMAGMTRRVLS